MVKKIENEKWMLKEFEERVKDKGLIIRGWVPQLLILGFMTHCGQNFILEGVFAGVPMVSMMSPSTRTQPE